MCLIFAALDAHPQYRLIVAAHRDEFHSRETARLAAWPRTAQHKAEVIAGRDLVGGGTWMGVTDNGRFSALTNFRGPAVGGENPPSRGGLVSGFLAGDSEAVGYLESVQISGPRYNGFSLLAFDGATFACYSNRADALTEIAPGVHGLSNHLLNSPWPKVTRGIDVLQSFLATDPAHDALVDRCFELLTDAQRPADHLLPDTGVGVERERALAPMFVLGDVYGTRSTAVVLIDNVGGISVHERSFDAQANEIDRVAIQRNIAAAA